VDVLGKGKAQMIHCKPISRIYYNAGNGYTVAYYATTDELPPQVERQNKGIRGSFTVVGIEIPMGEGLELEIDGEWKNNKKFGLQYEVSYYQWSIWGLWV
jgi:exodeoxyribonuclease V alpha subunit